MSTTEMATTCPDGTFGLNACRGPVTLVNGKQLCDWHRLKREIFGRPASRPVPPLEMRDCPTCGRTVRSPHSGRRDRTQAP